jgi:protein-disulfide isomerase
VFFCIVIVVKWLLCPYCVASHVGNGAFWITMELAGGRTRRPRVAWAAAIVVFLAASAAVAVWDQQQKQRRIDEGERELAESVQAIVERSHQPDSTTQPTTEPSPEPNEPAATPEEPPSVSPEVTNDAQPDEPDPNEEPPAPTDASEDDFRPFEGRYRYGPEAAPIRIVMITSYQCPDCRFIESQLHQIMRQRDDLAVSIKHFPFNQECNPFVSRTTQPNACWAARAAEAAGIIWGTQGFWKMHAFLFKQQGVFMKGDDLRPGFYDQEYAVNDFVKIMTSEETLRRVRADCKEAKQLGLYFTPMIFINGVELKGWYAPQALKRTVEAVATTNPPPRTATADHPPKAVEKYVADWREQSRVNLPEDRPARSTGTDNAKLRIVMWGDYQEPSTNQMDKTIRAFINGRDDAHYTYRHYPFNSDCNPHLSDQRHPHACRAAQAAEAAAKLGGEEAFWKMHVWLMEHRKEFSDETLRGAAAEIGLDPDALFKEMESPEVQAAIAQDIDGGKSLPRLRIGTPPGLHAIPTLFVNGRWVPRFKLSGARILDMIMEEALAEE